MAWPFPGNPPGEEWVGEELRGRKVESGCRSNPGRNLNPPVNRFRTVASMKATATGALAPFDS